jgi:hypothetical protein
MLNSVLKSEVNSRRLLCKFVLIFNLKYNAKNVFFSCSLDNEQKQSRLISVVKIDLR